MAKRDAVTGAVISHYSVNAQTYRNHYDASQLESSATYPAEYFRLRRLLERLAATGARRVLDAGCGEGTPMLRVSELGIEVRGFDFTPEMVEKAKELFTDAGLPERNVIEGNVESFESFQSLTDGGLFDAAVCFGVMPHVNDEVLVLENLRRALVPRGRVFVEFRNALFNLFTMNRFTHRYILEDLLHGVDPEIVKATDERLAETLAMDKPALRTKAEAGKPGYDAIRARMHNPLAIAKMFADGGFTDPVIHWYHFHPTLPLLEGDGVDPKVFRREAFRMEDNPHDWRGHLLCSAFVVEAVAR
ncbi:MAG: class I SAM-dependent methyltransferase [Hyphomicrobium sp.]